MARGEALLFMTLLQLAVIVAAGRVGAALARRAGQTAASGEILLGILLGPSLFGLVAPGAFHLVFRSAPPEPLQVLSSLGLVLLMFQVGLHFEFRHLGARSNRRAVLAVAAACLLLPFLLGLAFGFVSAPRLSPQANPLHSALFVATAFSITALPILGRILIEHRLAHQPIAVIAISAAAINDVVGWVLLAVVTAMTVGRYSGGSFALRIGLIVLYVAACLLLVRPALKRIVHASAPRDGRMSGNLIGIMLVMIFISAMLTHALGIFAIFGGFMMGVILHDEDDFVRAWRDRIGDFVQVFFLPIFFTYTGLRTSIGALDSLDAWGWCALTVLLACAGKLGGGYVAARLTGRSHPEAAALAFMMNTRALMELVVLNAGLDLGVISQRMFTMLVIMALLSTVVTTPALRRYLPRAGIPMHMPDARAG